MHALRPNGAAMLFPSLAAWVSLVAFVTRGSADCGTYGSCEKCAASSDGCAWCAFKASCESEGEATRNESQCGRAYSEQAECPRCEQRDRVSCLDDSRCGIINMVTSGREFVPFTGYAGVNASCVEGDDDAPFPQWPHPYPASSKSGIRRLPPAGAWLFGSSGKEQLRRECPHFVNKPPAPNEPADVGQCSASAPGSKGAHGHCVPGSGSSGAAFCQCTDTGQGNPDYRWLGQACETMALVVDVDNLPDWLSSTCGSQSVTPAATNFVSWRNAVCCDRSQTVEATPEGCKCRKPYTTAFSERTGGVFLQCHAACDVNSLCNRHGVSCGFESFNASLPRCTKCLDGWHYPGAQKPCAQNYMYDVQECQYEDLTRGPCAWNESAHLCTCHRGVDKSAGFPSDSCSLAKSQGDCQCECAWCNGYCIRGGRSDCEKFARSVNSQEPATYSWSCKAKTDRFAGLVDSLVIVTVVGGTVLRFWLRKVRGASQTWRDAISAEPTINFISLAVFVVFLVTLAAVTTPFRFTVVVFVMAVVAGAFWCSLVRGTTRTWPEAASVAIQQVQCSAWRWRRRNRGGPASEAQLVQAAPA